MTHQTESLGKCWKLFPKSFAHNTFENLQKGLELLTRILHLNKMNIIDP